MKGFKYISILFLVAGFLLISPACKKCKDPNGCATLQDKYGIFDPQPYTINYPQGAPEMVIPESNPLSKQGVDLGHRLFFDKIVSGDNTQSCSSCHAAQFGTTDNGLRFSSGIDGTLGKRNSMPLFNLGYGERFFWDGRAASLEEQVLMPIQDHTEMAQELNSLITELNEHADYPGLFYHAFGTDKVTGDLLAKSLAQYLRTLISFNSKYDSVKRNQVFYSDAELRGFDLFSSFSGGDCFHCHGEGNKLFSDFKFKNNGLDAAATIHDFPDPGFGPVTGKDSDYGTFKVPSLRNLILTPPYMHDGRFATLKEVIDHYSEGLKQSPNINHAELEFVAQGGVHLSQSEKDDIIAFLKTLTDYTIIDNPQFNQP